MKKPYKLKAKCQYPACNRRLWATYGKVECRKGHDPRKF